MANILLCDDEANLRQLLAMALEKVGHRLLEAEDGQEAIQLLETADWDLFITDLRLPDTDGLDLLRHAKKLAPEKPVVLITAFASTATAVTAMKEGAFDYLEKPFPMEDLHLLVTRALEQGALKRENQQLKQALKERTGDSEIIGNSPPMRHILELARRVARTDASVLISGESGTGKELIARFVHRHSPRADGPFVAINCAAIPENLIESELFGHEKGAFSGAVASRKGVFVEAENGTLLLDEIGEMPINVQAKLLRVLQERTVRPVGGTGDRKVDTRLITTTNRDLTDEVAQGRFREDLFYRINVVNLQPPPLRERREDIPLLAARFVALFARRYSLPVRGMTPEAMASLMSHPLPGNVRELENIIEGAVSLSTSNRVERSALPVTAPGAGNNSPDTDSPFQLPEAGIDLEAALYDLESQAISQALKKTSGNKTKAAGLLNLSFRSFRYRLLKLKREG